YGTGFLDPASTWMYAIIDLHDRIIFYLLIVLAIVVWFFTSAMFLNGEMHLAHLQHGHLEFVWTVTPALILWAIGLPSLKMLYMMDEILEASVSVKVMGNQWYWTYDGMTSFMTPTDELEVGEQRQLTVDNYLVLPVNTSIRLLVSSNDVIHSFALPNLAMKVDAIPGRLNSAGLVITRPSTYYGQCSELCGILHGF
ncbi:Cupredoxin, partial [Blyttiomyces helicus]